MGFRTEQVPTKGAQLHRDSICAMGSLRIRMQHTLCCMPSAAVLVSPITGPIQCHPPRPTASTTQRFRQLYLSLRHGWVQPRLQVRMAYSWLSPLGRSLDLLQTIRHKMQPATVGVDDYCPFRVEAEGGFAGWPRENGSELQ